MTRVAKVGRVTRVGRVGRVGLRRDTRDRVGLRRDMRTVGQVAGALEELSSFKQQQQQRFQAQPLKHTPARTGTGALKNRA